MTLPAPNLDDRRFQDLVDEAKRLVQQRCPEWSDHNVSDPGVTLIETFATMVDQLLYRLNRVPERHYVKFLDLIGVRRLPPAAARTDVTFRLSAPQPETVTVATGTEVSTVRTEHDEAVVFTTVETRAIIPCEVVALAASAAGGQVTAHPETVSVPVLAGGGQTAGSRRAGGTGPGQGTGTGTGTGTGPAGFRDGGADAGRSVPARPTGPGRQGSAGSEAAGRSASNGSGFDCFGTPPQPGDALLVGLSTAVPGCVVAVRLDCTVEGVGVDPRDPPLVWEAWDGERWAACEVERDGTGGLNQAGDVILHLPRGHTESVMARQRAGWLRCRALAPEPGQPGYSASPHVRQAAAYTVGGTAAAVHAEIVRDEAVGISEGIPAQRFVLERRPLVPGDDPVVLEVGAGPDWERWERVDDFAASGPDDRHFVLDESAGEVEFGPAVREADGSLRACGAVPAKGALLRMPAYRAGGGARGNVARGGLRVLKSSIPFVTAVENRRPAAGGLDGERVEEALRRGPLVLHTRNRAVTAADYEQLARTVAPEVARVRCVPAGDGEPAGTVRLLVVPAVAGAGGRLEFEQLLPAGEVLERIARYLDERRTLGSRVVVEPPFYQGLTVVARVRARPRADRGVVQRDALAALYRHFDPLTGGPDGTGWPFGRPVHVGEVYAALQQADGVELVEDARLFAADPATGERGAPADRLDGGPHSLVFSYEHQVRVES